jgi:hypothetical protein
VHWIIGGDGQCSKWRVSWAKLSGRGPFVYSSSPHHRLYHPLTCRPSHRPTRRRPACPGGLLSIPVMWVTWWPHPRWAPPPGSNISRTWNKIFRDDGEKDSPPPFLTRAKTCTSFGCGAQVPRGPTGRPSWGGNGKHVRQSCHVERPMCARVAVGRRLSHVARRYGGSGPRRSEETSLTRCQLRGPS